MNALERDSMMLAAGVVGIMILLAYLKNAAPGIVEAAPQVVADTAAAAVVGTGEVLGIPKTDVDQCQADLAAGHKWDASFSCPAGTYLRHVFD